MLHFQKLASSIPPLIEDLRNRRLKEADELASARAALLRVQELSDATAAPTVPTDYIIISADGSQIDLERHQAIPCFVINIGRVTLSYGAKPAATLESDAQVFYRDADIYVGNGANRRMVQVADIAARRDIQEAHEAAVLAEQYSKDAVVMLDGTLVRWTIENFDEATKKRLLGEYLKALETCRSAGVPAMSYISGSRGREVIDQLLQRDPSLKTESLTDASLYASVLKPGERSPLFASHSRIVELYGDHAVHFFYLNVGSEVARVEVPAWVATNEQYLNFIHAVSIDQARRGKGYPMALLEAHEQAVVTARDRETFFLLIEQQLRGIRPAVKITEKALAKRVRLV